MATTTVPATTRTADFLVGRDMALKMAADLRAVGADACSLDRDDLPGEQTDVALIAMRELMQRPELVPGFAAVLADLLGCEGATDLGYLGDLTLEDMRIAA